MMFVYPVITRGSPFYTTSRRLYLRILRYYEPLQREYQVAAMFSWFRGPPAQVSLSGESRLTVEIRNAPLFDVDVSLLDYVGFVHIGSNYSGGEHGWWVFGAPNIAHAISSSCPVVETIMRGPLAAAADRVGQIVLIQRLNSVPVLKRAKRHGGAVALSAPEVAEIHRDAAIRNVSSVQDFPLIS